MIWKLETYGFTGPLGQLSNYSNATIYIQINVSKSGTVYKLISRILEIVRLPKNKPVFWWILKPELWSPKLTVMIHGCLHLFVHKVLKLSWNF